MMKMSMLALCLTVAVLFSGCGLQNSLSSVESSTPMTEENESAALSDNSIMETVEENKEASQSEPEITHVNMLMGCYAIDIADKRQMVGASDVVFVGTMDKVGGSVYPFEQANYNPVYTELSITVNQVIKGDEVVGSQIEGYKRGGYTATGYDVTTTVELYESDFFPVEGKEYMFVGTYENDLLVFGCPYTIVPLEADATEVSTYSAEQAEEANNPDRQAIIDAYIDAYANEIPYEESVEE